MLHGDDEVDGVDEEGEGRELLTVAYYNHAGTIITGFALGARAAFAARGAIFADELWWRAIPAGLLCARLRLFASCAVGVGVRASVLRDHPHANCFAATARGGAWGPRRPLREFAHIRSDQRHSDKRANGYPSCPWLEEAGCHFAASSKTNFRSDCLT